MGVYNPDGLQIGINNRRTDEGHTSFSEVGGDTVGKSIGSLTRFVKGLSLGEGEKIAVKAAVLPADFAEDFTVIYTRLDFKPVSDDALVFEKLCDFLLTVGTDLVNVKAIVGLAEGFSFVQYTFPGKSRLKGFEN